MKLLNRRREKSEAHFKNLFDEIKGVAEELDYCIEIPRKPRRSVYRENYPSNVPETYFRQSVYIPALENIIQDIKSRFSNETLELYDLNIFFPGKQEPNAETVGFLVEKYSQFSDQQPNLAKQLLLTELESWKLKWEEDS